MKKIIYGEVGYCRGDGTCPGHDTIYEIRENHTAFIGMVFTDQCPQNGIGVGGEVATKIAHYIRRNQ